MKRITLLVLVALSGFALTAQAQNTVHARYAEQPEAFWTLLDMQFTESLESPVAQVRTQTLKNIVYFATFHRDKIDFSDNVRELVAAHRAAKTDEDRTLALAALHAVGSVAAMDYLNAHMTPEQTVEVRETMLAVLNEYYRSGAGVTV